MHYAIAAFGVCACWIWGDWRHWRRYLPTLLYVAAANLTYAYLADDHLLWIFHHGSMIDQKIVDLLYFFIISPSIAFLFLSSAAQRRSTWIWQVPSWAIGFTAIEYILYLIKGISYQYGWMIGWSLLFYTIMFPMLLLHYNKPLLAYPLSVVATAFYMIMFHVPLLKK